MTCNEYLNARMEKKHAKEIIFLQTKLGSTMKQPLKRTKFEKVVSSTRIF